MAFTHSYQYVIGDGAVRISTVTSINVEAAAQLDESIADGETDKEVTISFPLAGLKSFTLSSDQACTVKTNSSGAPQETFNLVANSPLIWTEGNGTAPIAGPVTALFVTNSSGSALRLQGLFGWDPTP